MDPRIVYINDYYADAQYLSDHGFTADAAAVVLSARERAVRRGLFGRVPGLIALWALLREERTAGRVLLVAAGFNERAALERLDEVLRPSSAARADRLIDFIELSELCRAAITEAESLGELSVGTEHLSLSMIHSNDTALSSVFADQKLVYFSLRQHVLRNRGFPTSAPLLCRSAYKFAQDYLRNQTLTQDAARLVSQSAECARRRGILGMVPIALLLWILLRWERKVGVAALEKGGVNLFALETDLDDLLQPQSGSECGLVMDLGQIATVVEIAVQEAGRLRHDYVSTEHLLLAVISADDEQLRPLLLRHNITPSILSFGSSGEEKGS